MLYKFKSKAAGDVIMLEPTGRRILQIIGKEPGAKGIILPADMPGAMAALQEAVREEEAKMREARERGDVLPEDAVILRQRAAPFIDMLRRCQSEDREIVWGV